MQISVKTVTGRVVPLTVEPSDTIEDVKFKVAEAEGSLVGMQVFIFDHKSLEDEKTLADYDVVEGSTIFMTLRLRNTIKFSVQTPAGKTIRIAASPEESIEAVKQKIQEKEGILADEQKLTFNDQKLENEKTLYSYEIKYNSTLQLE